MLALDVLYWACLFLGAAYVLMTLALGGVSHLVQSVVHHLDLGGGSDIGADISGGDSAHVDVGTIDVAHSTDFGGLDHGPADTGGIDVGHEGFAGHEAGNAGPGEHGTADAGGVSSHGDHGHHGNGHLNVWAFLNPTMASSFLIGFGGGGVISRITGAGVLPSMACAGLCGGLLYSYVWWIITKFFGGAQASSHTRRSQLVGLQGTSLTSIRSDRPGMIAVVVTGSRETFRAVSSQEDEIPPGVPVQICHVERDKVWVTRAGTRDAVSGDKTREKESDRLFIEPRKER